MLDMTRLQEAVEQLNQLKDEAGQRDRDTWTDADGISYVDKATEIFRQALGPDVGGPIIDAVMTTMIHGHTETDPQSH